MKDIKLGQSIVGTFANSDPKIVDVTSSLNGAYYDEYNLSGLDQFRQLQIQLQSPTGTLELINSSTGATIAQTSHDGAGTFSLAVTTFPGIGYKLRVTNSQLGDYQLALIDGGKATSIVSPYLANLIDDHTNSIVGTIGASGKYFSLASGGSALGGLTDIALAPNGQFYGIGATDTPSMVDLLYHIDPSLDRSNQVKLVSELQAVDGDSLSSSLKALEFSADNQLYALGYTPNGATFYQIDVDTNIATDLATLPRNFLIGGDLVYDAANQRFLATSLDSNNTSSDALWAIPLHHPAEATKIGQTGFTDVYGLTFENGQLFGLTAHIVPDGTGATRIKIDLSTGQGRFDRSITGTQTFGIGGAATILANSGELVLDLLNLDVPIGSKSQGLAQRTIDLSDYPGRTLKVDLTTTSDATYNNHIGLYVVEDEIGTIKLSDGSSLKPGDANYAVEAIKHAVLQAGKTDRQLNLEIVGGKIYAPVVVSQGSLADFVTKNPTNGGDGHAVHAYFNYIGANSDRVDHFRLMGNNSFGVEDIYGGGDRDYNDLMVNLNVRIA